MTTLTTDRQEGKLAGYIRLFLETPRSDDETVAYLTGLHDALQLIAASVEAHQGGAKP